MNNPASQTELTPPHGAPPRGAPSPLLAADGQLTQVGWSRQPLLDCNLENAPSGEPGCTVSWERSSAISSTHRRSSSSTTCTGWTTRRQSCLRYLGSQLPTRPWLACTTRRPGEGGFAAAEGTPPLPALTLRLEPLPADDAKTLALAAAGDRRLTDDELAALMERGAGNPLFLQKLASVGEQADEAEELPESVEALVATRIDQLAPGDRALLRWASVLGVSVTTTSASAT